MPDVVEPRDQSVTEMLCVPWKLSHCSFWFDYSPARLRSGKTRKHVSRNTCSACMFPQCFPVLPHGKHCFQRQFCFQEAKFASATRQKHFVFPRGMEAWQNEETITETRFWKYVSLFCQGFTAPPGGLPYGRDGDVVISSRANPKRDLDG